MTHLLRAFYAQGYADASLWHADQGPQNGVESAAALCCVMSRLERR